MNDSDEENFLISRRDSDWFPKPTPSLKHEPPLPNPCLDHVEPVLRLDWDAFQYVGEPRTFGLCPGFASSAGIFSRGDKRYYGKAIPTDHKETALADSLKEVCANGIYRTLGCHAQTLMLSEQNWLAPKLYTRGLTQQSGIHLMSELIDGFRPFGPALVGQLMKGKDPAITVTVDGIQLPVRGLGQIIAVGMLLNDTDCIGGAGGNVGFTLVTEPERYVQAIKIDPGQAFRGCHRLPHQPFARHYELLVNSFKALSDGVAFINPTMTFKVRDLPPPQRKEFLECMADIIRTSVDTIRGWLSCPGLEALFPTDRVLWQFVEFLDERRLALQAAFPECGPVSQLLDITSPLDCLSAIKASYSQVAVLTDPVTGDKYPVDSSLMNLYLLRKRGASSSQRPVARLYSRDFESDLPSDNRDMQQQTGADQAVLLSSFETTRARKLELAVDDIFVKCRGSTKRVNMSGGAGVGKSTCCQSIVSRWAAGQLFPEFDLVVWVPLRRLTSARYPSADHYTVQDVIIQECLDSVQPSLALKTVVSSLYNPLKTLWILDGYDELVSRMPDQLTAVFSEMMSAPNRILTGRPFAMTSLPSEDHDVDVEVAGFNDENVRKFVDTFLQRAGPTRCVLTADGFVQQLRRSRLIWDLSHIPMNLVMLCHVLVDSEAVYDVDGLPLTELYVKMEARLRRQFSLELGRQPVTGSRHQDQLFVWLYEVAYQAMKQSVSHFSGRCIADWLSSAFPSCNLDDDVWPTLLTSCRILVRTDGDAMAPEKANFQFLHLTLQEYLAAKRIAGSLSGDAALPSHEMDWLRAHKYGFRFEVMWWFVGGLLGQIARAGRPAGLAAFAELATSAPRDVSRVFEARVWLRVIEEGRLWELPDAVRPAIVDNALQRARPYTTGLDGIVSLKFPSDPAVVKIREVLEHCPSLCRAVLLLESGPVRQLAVKDLGTLVKLFGRALLHCDWVWVELAAELRRPLPDATVDWALLEPLVFDFPQFYRVLRAQIAANAGDTLPLSHPELTLHQILGVDSSAVVQWLSNLLNHAAAQDVRLQTLSAHLVFSTGAEELLKVPDVCAFLRKCLSTTTSLNGTGSEQLSACIRLLKLVGPRLLDVEWVVAWCRSSLPGHVSEVLDLLELVGQRGLHPSFEWLRDAIQLGFASQDAVTFRRALAIVLSMLRYLSKCGCLHLIPAWVEGMANQAPWPPSWSQHERIVSLTFRVSPVSLLAIPTAVGIMRRVESAQDAGVGDRFRLPVALMNACGPSLLENEWYTTWLHAASQPFAPPASVAAALQSLHNLGPSALGNDPAMRVLQTGASSVNRDIRHAAVRALEALCAHAQVRHHPQVIHWLRAAVLDDDFEVKKHARRVYLQAAWPPVLADPEECSVVTQLLGERVNDFGISVSFCRLAPSQPEPFTLQACAFDARVLYWAARQVCICFNGRSLFVRSSEGRFEQELSPQHMLALLRTGLAWPDLAASLCEGISALASCGNIARGDPECCSALLLAARVWEHDQHVSQHVHSAMLAVGCSPSVESIPPALAATWSGVIQEHLAPTRVSIPPEAQFDADHLYQFLRSTQWRLALSELELGNFAMQEMMAFPPLLHHLLPPRVLIKSMNSHVHCPVVQTTACAFICRMVELGGALKADAFVAAGGLFPLLEALDTHPGLPQVVIAALTAVGLLAASSHSIRLSILARCDAHTLLTAAERATRTPGMEPAGLSLLCVLTAAEDNNIIHPRFFVESMATFPEFLSALNSHDDKATAAGLRAAVAVVNDDHIVARSSPFGTTGAPVTEIMPCNGMLLEYLTASPSAAELFNLWDTIGHSSTHRCVCGLLRCFGAVLAFGPNDITVPIARRIIRTKAKALLSQFAGTNPAATGAAADLLSAAVALSPVIAREFVSRFPLAFKPFQRHAASTVSVDTEYGHVHLRSTYVRLVCALLSTLAADVTAEVCGVRGLVAGVVRGLCRDPPELILSTLHTLRLTFVEQSRLPLSLKRGIFNRACVRELASVCDSPGPTVSSCALSFLSSLLPLLCPPEDHAHTHGLVSQLLSVLKPWVPAHADACVSLEKLFPCCLAEHCAQFPHSLEPRPVLHYFSSAALITTLLRRQKPESSPPWPLPAHSSKAALTRGLLHSNRFVCALSLDLLSAVLTTRGQSKGGHASSSSTIASRLPDFQTLVNVTLSFGSKPGKGSPLLVKCVRAMRQFVGYAPEIATASKFDLFNLYSAATDDDPALLYEVLGLLLTGVQQGVIRPNLWLEATGKLLKSPLDRAVQATGLVVSRVWDLPAAQIAIRMRIRPTACRLVAAVLSQLGVVSCEGVGSVWADALGHVVDGVVRCLPMQAAISCIGAVTQWFVDVVMLSSKCVGPSSLATSAVGLVESPALPSSTHRSAVAALVLYALRQSNLLFPPSSPPGADLGTLARLDGIVAASFGARTPDSVDNVLFVLRSRLCVDVCSLVVSEESLLADAVYGCPITTLLPLVDGALVVESRVCSQSVCALLGVIARRVRSGALTADDIAVTRAAVLHFVGSFGGQRHLDVLGGYLDLLSACLHHCPQEIVAQPSLCKPLDALVSSVAVSEMVDMPPLLLQALLGLQTHLSPPARARLSRAILSACALPTEVAVAPSKRKKQKPVGSPVLAIFRTSLGQLLCDPTCGEVLTLHIPCTPSALTALFLPDGNSAFPWDTAAALGLLLQRSAPHALVYAGELLPGALATIVAASQYQQDTDALDLTPILTGLCAGLPCTDESGGTLLAAVCSFPALSALLSHRLSLSQALQSDKSTWDAVLEFVLFVLRQGPPPAVAVAVGDLLRALSTHAVTQKRIARGLKAYFTSQSPSGGEITVLLPLVAPLEDVATGICHTGFLAGLHAAARVVKRSYKGKGDNNTTAALCAALGSFVTAVVSRRGNSSALVSQDRKAVSDGVVAFFSAVFRPKKKRLISLSGAALGAVRDIVAGLSGKRAGDSGNWDKKAPVDGVPALHPAWVFPTVTDCPGVALLFRQRLVLTASHVTPDGLPPDTPALASVESSCAHIVDVLKCLVYSHKASASHGALLMVLVGYGGTLSPLDLRIRHLLSAYERVGVSLASVGYCFGPAALSETDRLLALSDTDAAEGHHVSHHPQGKPSMDWLLGGGEEVVGVSVGGDGARSIPVASGLDLHRLDLSCSRFPTRRPLDGEDLAMDGQYTHCDAAIPCVPDVTPRSSGVYDPSFVFPALVHGLSVARLTPRRLISCGALGFALCGLSSFRADVRSLAYVVLGKVYDMLTGLQRLGGYDTEAAPPPQESTTVVEDDYTGVASFRELPQVLLALEVLRGSVATPCARLPSTLTAFISRTLPVLLKPGHAMYPLLNKFLLRHCETGVPAGDVPMFHSLFLNGEAATVKKTRAWCLEYLDHALQSGRDHGSIAGKGAYSLLLSFAEGSVFDEHVQRNVWGLLARVCGLVSFPQPSPSGGKEEGAGEVDEDHAGISSGKPFVPSGALHLHKRCGILTVLSLRWCTGPVSPHQARVLTLLARGIAAHSGSLTIAAAAALISAAHTLTLCKEGLSLSGTVLAVVGSLLDACAGIGGTPVFLLGESPSPADLLSFPTIGSGVGRDPSLTHMVIEPSLLLHCATNGLGWSQGDAALYLRCLIARGSLLTGPSAGVGPEQLLTLMSACLSALSNVQSSLTPQLIHSTRKAVLCWASRELTAALSAGATFPRSEAVDFLTTSASLLDEPLGLSPSPKLASDTLAGCRVWLELYNSLDVDATLSGGLSLPAAVDSSGREDDSSSDSDSSDDDDNAASIGSFSVRASAALAVSLRLVSLQPGEVGPQLSALQQLATKCGEVWPAGREV